MTEHPRRPDDDVTRSMFTKRMFAGEFCLSIDAERRSRRVGCIWDSTVPAENIVGGNVNDWDSRRSRCAGDVARAVDVDGAGELLFRLRAVNRGIRGAVDDRIRPTCANRRLDGRCVRDVQLGSRMRENGPVRARRALAHFASRHSTGAGDHEPPHLRKRQVRAVAREWLVRRVLCRKKRLVNRPLDSDERIVPHNPSVVRRFVRNGAFVDHVGNFRQYTEPMGETLGHPERGEVFIAQLHSEPLCEGWRTAPDIHCDVEDLSARDVNQLPLWMVQLVMESPHDRLRRPAVVVLGEVLRQRRTGKAPGAESLQEESALIAEDLRVKEQHSWQRSLANLHRTGLISSSSDLKYPAYALEPSPSASFNSPSSSMNLIR